MKFVYVVVEKCDEAPEFADVVIHGQALSVVRIFRGEDAALRLLDYWEGLEAPMYPIAVEEQTWDALRRRGDS